MSRLDAIDALLARGVALSPDANESAFEHLAWARDRLEEVQLLVERYLDDRDDTFVTRNEWLAWRRRADS